MLLNGYGSSCMETVRCPSAKWATATFKAERPFNEVVIMEHELTAW